MTLNKFRFILAFASLCALPIIALGAQNSIKPNASQAQAEKSRQDIQQTLGIVPTFIGAMPDSLLPGAWQELKSLMFNPRTALRPGLKDLISLAVDAQVPCRYCSYWDSESARLDGVTPPQMREAVAMASETRHWSTILNGLQLDDAKFKKQTDQIFRLAKSHKADKAPAQMAVVTTPEEAYRDIRNIFGIVPDFLQSFPREGIVGAWLQMRDFQLNPSTQLKPKDKELIGLAVAAQIPCRYCVRFHTEAAKLNGANDREIRESLAVAGISRQWSTILNGNQTDEAEFRSQVDQIMTFLRSKQSPSQMGGAAADKSGT